MSRRHGLAIVGLGMALEPHARSIADLSDRVDVIGAWSRSGDRCRAVAEKTGFAITTDLDALIADPRVDIALILTPPSSHSEIAKRFLAAGKHVLVEKPLEVSQEEGDRLVACAAAADRRLGVVLQHRFRTSSLALARMLAQGTLGNIVAATCTVPWWRHQSYYDEPGRGTYARDGGGVLITQAIHTLDLFRSLVGSIESVVAAAATTSVHRMEAEDFVSGTFRLSGSVFANFMATTAAYPGFSDSIILVCERGTANLVGNSLTVSFHDGRVETVADGKPLGGGSNPMDFPHDSHLRLIEDFLSAVEEEREPRVCGRDALRTQDLIETILASARERAWRDVPKR